MADVYVTLVLMPTGPDVDTAKIAEDAKRVISTFGGRVTEHAEKPFAFGLKQVEIVFVMPEEKGDLEPLEKELQGVEGVESVQVTRVSRAFG